MSLLAFYRVRLNHACGSARHRSIIGIINVGHAQGNILHAVAVLKDMLGDKGDLTTAIMEKTKAKIDGKTVTAEFGVTGKTIEKLLAKDN